MPPRQPRRYRIARLGAGLIAILACGVALNADAQIEGPERGVRPINSSGDYEVSGIVVNVTGKNAEEARLAGWREAQRKGWSQLWARTHNGQTASLADGVLEGIVTAIVVDQEQIGPRRYVARLGVLFDRARAGEILGVSGNVVRSAPMLVIPVLHDAGTATVFEHRTEWQKAWARFRTAESRVDYVRPSGSGAESLLINAGQIGRRNREWWRGILDEFGAADIVVPIARLERQWPGGPIVGRFAARYGPDNRYLGAFTLRTSAESGLPGMMDLAVKRMDDVYTRALARGLLRPDRSLIIEEPIDLNALKVAEAIESANTGLAGDADGAIAAPIASVSAVLVQFDTPDAAAVDAVLAAVRAVPGVQGASTSSLALGGVSEMQVQYAGDTASLRAALFARGWQVNADGNRLRIRRNGP